MLTTIDFRKYIIHITPVKAGSSMHEVFDQFRKNKEYTFMPVIDDFCRPIGIIREYSLKDYTYGMFGRELIRKMRIAEFITACTVIAIDSKLEEVLCLATAELNTDGCIITDNGQYHGVILNKALLNLYEENRLMTAQWLQRAERMEAIGTMAGGIAHDFNNILTPILGYSELLGRVLENDKYRSYIDQIRMAGLRAKELVNQILTFSRQKKEERVPVSVGMIVKEVAKLLTSSLPSKVEIKTVLSDDPDVVLADPIHIHRVILNLCSNAIYAMRDKGGFLKISLSKGEKPPGGWIVGDDKLGGGDYVCLSVSDTGTGINPKILERIFDPFFTTKSHSDGTGLGLSVVHGIVKGNNGLISVETEVGVGSTFHVYFPLVKDTIEEKKFTSGKGPDGKNLHIMFVDDEEIIIGIATESLSHFGFRVTAFTDSNEAWFAFRNNPFLFNAIVTDQAMPELTGIELAKRVFEIRSDMPVILCTGYSNSVSPETAKALGVSRFFYKPVVFRDVAEQLCMMIK
jgi:signal transduction histidine kinase